MPRVIYLDIETCAQPVQSRLAYKPTRDTIKLGNLRDESKIAAKVYEAVAEWESGSECGLDPFQAKIAIVGIMEGGDYNALTLINFSEAELLTEAWSILSPSTEATTDLEIVGHNIRFDAGMMVRRSWLLGVDVPRGLVADLYKKEPRHWRDTMMAWSLGSWPPEYIKLDKLALAFGVKCKQGEIHGSNFGEWWAKDKAACIDYNEQDILATRMVWEKIHGSHKA